jgi:hypothetical protein
MQPARRHVSNNCMPHLAPPTHMLFAQQPRSCISICTVCASRVGHGRNPVCRVNAGGQLVTWDPGHALPLTHKQCVTNHAHPPIPHPYQLEPQVATSRHQHGTTEMTGVLAYKPHHDSTSNTNCVVIFGAMVSSQHKDNARTNAMAGTTMQQQGAC